uniref:Uncharacterized protein n=1 Tax=Mycena chlorophos TaxID=658473 RepID=A0ABQ0L2G4_MYCCL|nr:predicted protein [Mycena chlorophos]
MKGNRMVGLTYVSNIACPGPNQPDTPTMRFSASVSNGAEYDVVSDSAGSRPLTMATNLSTSSKGFDEQSFQRRILWQSQCGLGGVKRWGDRELADGDHGCVESEVRRPLGTNVYYSPSEKHNRASDAASISSARYAPATSSNKSPPGLGQC